MCAKINEDSILVDKIETFAYFVERSETVYYISFGENLKKLRQSRNLTQQELGLQISLSKAVVSKYEKGISYPAFDVLLRIASFFEVTTDYLLGVSREKTIDVSGLSENQINIIHGMITELRKANKKTTAESEAAHLAVASEHSNRNEGDD